MKTISHNSSTSSVSVTAASGNDQPQLVATIVPDEQRISFWPQHFGLIPQWVTLGAPCFRLDGPSVRRLLRWYLESVHSEQRRGIYGPRTG